LQTVLHGRARNTQRASDIVGVYAAAGAGLAVGGGVRAIGLTNQRRGLSGAGQRFEHDLIVCSWQILLI
jgi:hypothetical protein